MIDGDRIKYVDKLIGIQVKYAQPDQNKFSKWAAIVSELLLLATRVEEKAIGNAWY